MMAPLHIAATPAFAGIGAFAGYLHMKLLSRNVRALFGRARAGFAMATPLIRGAISIAAFSAAVMQGAPPLVAALVGFLIARAIILRRPEALLR